MKRLKKQEIIFFVLVLAVIAAGLLLPKTGELVLLDEFCDLSVIWIVCAYLVIRVVRNRTLLSASRKALGTGVVIVCFALALWFSKDLVLDLSSGSQTVELKDIQVSESLAHTGIFSHHYYLTGSDNEDEILRLEISGEDYGRLQQGQTVRVEYYKHTGRIVKVD